MGFFSKTDNQDKWKNKYLNLLEAQAHSKQVDKETEDLLCKTIIRLSFAVSGFDPQLDAHMQRIRHHLKNSVDSHKLKVELESFSRILTQLNDIPANSTPPDAKLLFEFLLAQYTSPLQNKALEQIKDSFAQQSIENPRHLFNALLEIIGPVPGNAEQAKNQGPADDRINTSLVSKALSRLLNGLEIPAPFAQQAQTLNQQLASHPTAPSLESLLDQSVTILHNIERHIQAERQEIDRFLSQVTDKLSTLGLAAAGANTAVREAAQNRNQLDHSVSEQMQDLQQRSLNATQLGPLKEIINTRLASLTKELRDHGNKEALQRQQSQQQLDELTRKIQDLESESSQLHSKLTIAQFQALRDTLTGLPNRLAYNERLDAELARWRRYRSPLSLLIWDVDHFKGINDRFGHKAGDKTLTIIARELSKNCRQTDFIARFGGEEFTMLLPDTDKASAFIVANKLRSLIEHTGFNSKGQAICITLSCGITEFVEGDCHETAFDRADKALYQAKHLGRNQCCLA